MIYLYAFERALGHPGEERVVRVLNDRHAAAPLDSRETHGAVVESSRQDHAHHTRSVRDGRAAEQGIHRRPVVVLLRPVREANDPVLQEEVAVWARDVDATGLYGQAVFAFDGF